MTVREPLLLFVASLCLAFALWIGTRHDTQPTDPSYSPRNATRYQP